MTDHPLTRKKCWEIYVEKVSGESWEIIPDIETSFRTCMQAAYDKGRDEQCEQVIKWLYDNLDEYSTDADPGFFLPMWRLISDLELAMRPTQEDNK